MVINLSDRARGALLGLAVGDALGNPTEGKSPEVIAAKWGRVTDFLTEEQGGSDDTEYALFNAQLLIARKHDLTPADVADAWRRDILNAANTYKGAGFSEIIVIRRLSDDVDPPASGRHVQSWSDGLAMRVAPFGIVAAGDPRTAAHLAKVDGSVSHAGEGIYGGQAVAAAVALAMDGRSVEEIVRGSLDVVPESSWTAASIARGVRIGGSARDVWSALEPLYDAIACPFYFWTDVAPEAVGIAFGLVVAAQGKFEDAVLGGVNIGRDADTIAAIVGSICGAIGGVQAIPERWRRRVTSVRGTCIKAVKDLDILSIADKLAQLAESWKFTSMN